MTIISTTASEAISARLTSDRESIELRISRDGDAVLEGIRVGIVVDGVALSGNVTVRGVDERTVSETWTARSGKAVGERHVSHVESTVRLIDNPTGREWAIVVRAAQDGVAIRYVLPSDARELGQELTSIPVAPTDRAWLLDYQTWYETPRFGADIAELADGEYGFPLLLRSGSSHVLVTESDIDGRFAGAHPVFANSAFTLVTADAVLDVDGGIATPWRVFIVGDLDTVVGSTLVDDLAPAASAELAAAAWIRPGRAAWSWWSSQYSGAYLEHQKRFADYAADRGWEHVLVDCGWDETWMPDLVAHASRRGVQVHVWSSWSDLDGPTALKKLALWQSWGVAGIKVDFMESESRERYRWYDAIIAESARVGLMVNFHGSVIPRGWAKTYPHIIGYEGIRGAEYYVFYGEPLTAAHNVIQPFTRNVVGAMDYTPVTFSAPRRETSEAHELALSVAFESGITHFADEVAEYARRPLAEAFLSEVAPSWDETRLVGGTPDTEAVIARRSGERWFIGCIATGEPRTITVDLSSLALGDGERLVITDGADGLIEAASIGDTLAVDIARNGGFVALLAAPGTALRRAETRAAVTPPMIEPAVQSIAPGGTATLTVSEGASLRLPTGWSATGDGTAWIVSAPSDLRPGALGVVTAEFAGEVPVVAHARLVSGLGSGSSRISSLPFVSCSNEVGPVERDLANGGGDPRDGAPMAIAGRSFEHGLGVSAPSHVELHLAATATRLTGFVGIDDETAGASGTARVVADGVELARFNLVNRPDVIDLDVTGVKSLRLEVLPGEGTEAHIDWAQLELHSPGA